MPKQNKFRDLPRSRQHSNPKNMRRATLMVWGITRRHVVEMYSSLSIYYLDSDIEPSPLGTLIHTFNSTSPWLLIASVFNSFSASAKHFLDLCSTVQRCVTTCTGMRNRWRSHLLSCPLQLGWAMLSQKMRLLVANLQISSLLPWETEHKWLRSCSAGWRAQGVTLCFKEHYWFVLCLFLAPEECHQIKMKGSEQ